LLSALSGPEPFTSLHRILQQRHDLVFDLVPTASQRAAGGIAMAAAAELLATLATLTSPFERKLVR
jgi:hypothetical protein